MPYCTATVEIEAQIARLSDAKVLWIDTEVADYRTKTPRLSLIQILDQAVDPEWVAAIETLADQVWVLDVLDRPELVEAFVQQVMMNGAIAKVFHNAQYDLQFLGKTKAKNVTCTLKMAKSIPYYCLPIANQQLKTLAKALCNLTVVKEQQASDWGKRPLTAEQFRYASLDPVYLANVHGCLLDLYSTSVPDPITENIAALATRYLEIQHQWKLLDTEKKHLEERLKQAMQSQNQLETEHCVLARSTRSLTKVTFTELARLMQTQAIDVDFPITLTQDLQKKLGPLVSELQLQVEESLSWRLTFKEADEADSDA